MAVQDSFSGHGFFLDWGKMGEVAEAIQVMIVDDEDLVRAAIAALLAPEPDICVVAGCRSIAEAVNGAAITPVDVIVVDSQLGGAQKGVDLIHASREAGFDGAMIILGSNLSDSEALHALRQGATGIVLKSDSPDTLPSAIRKVSEGGCWVADQYVKMLVTGRTHDHKDLQKPLSGREVSVLRGISKGSTNKEIATELGISESAVKSTLQHLFRKTGTRSRSRLVVVAIDRYAKYL
jgi:two-component system, NarL family, nitrate/nitrite response regulator NarL